MQTNNDSNNINELNEENNLLLSHLKKVQDELELYYNKSKEYERMINEQNKNKNFNFDKNSEIEKIITENNKLKLKIKILKKIQDIKLKNSLSIRLGNILIDSVKSKKEIFLLPFKLFNIWRAWAQRTPPKALGGENFSSLLQTYETGGVTEIEKILDSHFVSPHIKADAYTKIARHVKNIDPNKSVEFAKKAYETDPQSYRLKWLAFRLYDAGDVKTSDTILAILKNISMSDWELQQSKIIHTESEYVFNEESKKIISNILNIKEIYNKQHIKNENNLELTIDTDQIDSINKLFKNKITQYENEKKEYIDQIKNLKFEIKKTKESFTEYKIQISNEQKDLLSEKNDYERIIINYTNTFNEILLEFKNDHKTLLKIIKVFTRKIS